jgi:hypothetical protein
MGKGSSRQAVSGGTLVSLFCRRIYCANSDCCILLCRGRYPSEHISLCGPLTDLKQPAKRRSLSRSSRTQLFQHVLYFQPIECQESPYTTAAERTHTKGSLTSSIVSYIDSLAWLHLHVEPKFVFELATAEPTGRIPKYTCTSGLCMIYTS